MRVLSVFHKTLREQTRDLLTLTLSLVLAPAMVFIYWLFFPGGSTTYGVSIINHDLGAPLASGATLRAGEEIITVMKAVTYADGKPLLEVVTTTDRADAEARLKNRDAEVLIIIPPDFSQAIQTAREGRSTERASLTFIGDLTNPYYAIAAVMANAAIDQYVQSMSNQPRPIEIVEQPLGASAARTEFENYVPGLLVFAVVMLIFVAAMTVAREVESGALRRLQITRMTSFDLLGGISAAIALIGALAVVLTFVTAMALGFRSQGSVWVAIAIGIVTTLSVVGVGLIVACFSKTVSQAFMVANVPLVLFMFFSGAIFPLPRVPLFTIGAQTIGLYDILPPTHAVVALNKVLTLGAGLSDVMYELAMLLALSVIYFAVGVWLFKRTHLKAA